MKNQKLQNYFTQNKLKIERQNKNQQITDQKVQEEKNQQINKNYEFYNNPSLFDQYLALIKQKVLKRKIILIILNSILTIQAFIYIICLILWQTADYDQSQIEINKIFSTQNKLPTIICGVTVLIISSLFTFFIYKGKVMMLHCYWITSLIFLIIFAIIGASAYSITKGSCEQPTNYLLQKLRMSSLSANSLYCSDSCPCSRNQIKNYTAQITTFYNKVQDCPGWTNKVQSNFFSIIEKNMKCSGWCKINQNSYYTFIDSNQIDNNPPTHRISCYSVIQNKLVNQVQYVKIFSIFTSIMLLLIIFYVNYYIFMQKEDQENQLKKMKKRIKKTNKKMEEQLKSSQRMLQ